jgi:hypothetical protein
MMRRGHRRRRLLQAYARGFRQAREAMQTDLEATRISLEREVAILRAEVRKLRAEYVRAQQIECALETECEFNTRLQ